jgi:hypothetical protein
MGRAGTDRPYGSLFSVRIHAMLCSLLSLFIYVIPNHVKARRATMSYRFRLSFGSKEKGTFRFDTPDTTVTLPDASS